jgi:hypothetical protein
MYFLDKRHKLADGEFRVTAIFVFFINEGNRDPSR